MVRLLISTVLWFAGEKIAKKIFSETDVGRKTVKIVKKYGENFFKKLGMKGKSDTQEKPDDN